MSFKAWLLGATAAAAVAGFVWLNADRTPAEPVALAQVTRPPTTPPVPPVNSIPDCPDAAGASPFGRPCVPATMKNLPPDPGPAGDATPAGFDVNGNGIRDDVERYIAAVFPDPPQLRASLMQYAHAFAPMASRRLKSAEEALSISEQMLRALACQSQLIVPGPRAFTAAELKESERWTNAARDTRLMFLNTPERLRIFIDNERFLAGRTVDMPSELDPKKLCDFDLRSSAN